jgi:hypothetical protein
MENWACHGPLVSSRLASVLVEKFLQEVNLAASQANSLLAPSALN